MYLSKMTDAEIRPFFVVPTPDRHIESTVNCLPVLLAPAVSSFQYHVVHGEGKV